MLPIPRWKDGLLWIFGLLLFAAFLGVFAPKGEAQVGPPNQILCNNLAQASPTAVTSQVLSLVGVSGSQPVLRGVAGQRIYIFGWHLTATAATPPTFQLVAGTDSATTPASGGTQTKIYPAHTL